MKGRMLWVLIAVMVIITMLLPTCMPPPRTPVGEAPTEPALTMVGAGSSLSSPTPIQPTASPGGSGGRPELASLPASPASAPPAPASAASPVKPPARAQQPPQSPTPTRTALARPPDRDLIDLSRRLRPGFTLPPTPPVARAASIGDRADFWVLDADMAHYYQAPARLAYITDHAYAYVVDGLDVSPDAIGSSIEAFEKTTYPTLRRYFGSEASPGIDNDVHITILNVRVTGADGYFSSTDEFPRAVNKYSNERELIYINASTTRPGTPAYDAVLAHEFTHMIQHNVAPSGDAWIFEGQAELGAHTTAGAPVSRFIQAYLSNPNTARLDWDPGAASLTHYGAAYLFLSYFAEHYGGYEAVGRLVRLGSRGADALDSALREMNIDASFDQIFADWLAASQLSGTGADGRYAFAATAGRPRTTPVGDQPFRHRDVVAPYGAVFFELARPRGDATIEFEGATVTSLAGAAPYEGQWEWWSNRGDLIDSRLTRTIDLPLVSNLSLTYRIWFDTERAYDNCYVEASTDGGATWTGLRGNYTTPADDLGLSFGHAYSGRSGVEATPGWVEEQIDLTPFAGRRIMLRFEYVTDDAYNANGIGLDNIAIPAAGFFDGAESDSGWIAEGFVRSNNTTIPRYAVQVISVGATPRVEQMVLDDRNAGRLVVPAGAGDPPASIVVAITNLTRYTRLPSEYTVTIRRTP